MKEIFLSASVPVPGRGTYYESADPYLIQVAVCELVAATVRDHVLVWGGHPAITPMVWAVCEDLGVEYAKSVVLYQSRLFEDVFPVQNAHFDNVVFVPAVDRDRDASLLLLRSEMLSRPDLRAAVFIGGMEGVLDEFRIFRGHHPDAGVLAVGAAGGASRELVQKLGHEQRPSASSIDFARIYRDELLPMLR